MGKRKGQAPVTYLDGTLDKYNLKNRTPEERKAFAKKGAETRRKNKEEKLALQKVMRALLSMRVSSDKQKQVLKQIGFEDAELTNKTLLMTALFKKGLTGDVSAIKEITDMMDKLELFESGKDVRQQPVIINLVPTGEPTPITEQDEQDIWKAENGIPLTDIKDMEEWNTDDSEIWNEEGIESEEDDWGNEVYDG